MAGGEGKRLYPYTKVLPKPLIPIGDLPICTHVIESFRKFGCDNFTLILNHKSNMIKAYYNDIQKDYSLDYVEETKFLGTAGGLSLLKGKIKDTCFVSNCDILVDADFSCIYKWHKKEQNMITMVCALKEIKIPYGVTVNPENGEIFVTDATDYVTPGYLYCFTPEGQFKWKVRTGDIPAHFAFSELELK